MRISLTPSRRLGDYPFVHRIRPRFAETDAMGIIHHSAYLPYLEEARAALLHHVGHPYTGVRTQGIDFAVLEVAVRYRQPLHFDDPVDIGVLVGDVTRTFFQVAYLLDVAGTACSTAVTVHAAVTIDGRPGRLPVWLADVAHAQVPEPAPAPGAG